MNAKFQAPTASTRPPRSRFNPVRGLRPETLSRALDSFEDGRLGPAARMFEAIINRDDIISGLSLKRKKSVARLEHEIILLEDSDRAREHRKVLRDFYSTLECTSFADANKRGGLRLLISQMMDSVGYRYSVHKLEFLEDRGRVRGLFCQYPLWLFENTEGVLRLLDKEGQLTPGRGLDAESWMVCCGDGLMVASSIAYLFKQLPLRDWLVYCERNGMPGIKAKTDAYPDSPQWEAACEAVRDFGAEFHAVLSQGTDIEAIDVSTRGELPYPALVERIDRLLCTLWRGSDLSSMSASGKVGASVQAYEETILEEDDAANISDTLNRWVDPQVIRLGLGDDIPLARFRLKLPDYEEHKCELEIIERLYKLGLKPDAVALAEKFAYPLTKGKDRPDGGEL